MYSLFVDTATDIPLIALAKDSAVIKSIYLESSSKVVQGVDDLLRRAKLVPKDITFLNVGVGPGSYTGIRVAISFIKGISIALNIPIVPIPTLYTLVPQSGDDCTFISAIDAKVGGVYLVEGKKQEGGISWTSRGERVDDSDFVKRLESVDNLIVLDSSWLERKKMDQGLPVMVTSPKAEECVRFGFSEWNLGRAMPSQFITPLYLRKTQAEIEKIERDRRDNIK